MRFRQTCVREHRFAADRRLADRDKWNSPNRQVNVEAAAETNDTEAFARREIMAFGHVANDAPRDEARNLAGMRRASPCLQPAHGSHGN